MSDLCTPIDICLECIRTLGGEFYESKRQVFLHCSLCKKLEATQNFMLKFVDELPPKTNEDNK